MSNFFQQYLEEIKAGEIFTYDLEAFHKMYHLLILFRDAVEIDESRLVDLLDSSQ